MANVPVSGTLASDLDETVVVLRMASPVGQVWRRFRRNWPALLSVVVLVLLVLLAILAPYLTPGITPNTQFLLQVPTSSAAQAPSLDHFPLQLMGITNIYDSKHSVFVEVAYGARVSLSIGLIGALVTAIIGTLLGALAGYFGGWIDGVIMRVTDLALAFPFLPLVIAITIAGSITVTPQALLLLFSLLDWPVIARLVRAQLLAQREREYVEAAVAQGVPHLRILFRHLLPLVLAPVFVVTALNAAAFILAEASLDYILLGITDQATWGNIIAANQNFLDAGFWWPVVFPGLFIIITVLAINYIGEGLRDALDVSRTVR